MAASLTELDQVNFLQHPVLSAKLTQLRAQTTNSANFRRLAKEITYFLALEGTRDLTTLDVAEESPLAQFDGAKIDQKVALVPILRSGSVLLDPMLEFLPEASVYHLGLYRDKVTLLPTEYYSKLPSQGLQDHAAIYVLDIILATGSTAVAAINMLLDAGVQAESIRLLVVCASLPGIQHVLAACPGVQLYIAAVDSDLSQNGYILPGLGDAGDRLYQT